MRKYLNKVLSSSYVKDFVILSLGTILSQVVPMLFYPIISRLFSPEDFGLLTSLTTVSTILITIVTLGYHTSIILSENKSEAINIVMLTLSLSVIISIFIFVFLLFYRKEIPFYSGSSKLIKYFWISFFMSFFVIIYKLYNEWNVRFKEFKHLSINKVVNSSSVSISELLFGYFIYFNGIGLVLGDLIGRFVSAMNCVFFFLKKNSNFLKDISFCRMYTAALKYKDCPKYISLSLLLNSLGGSLPVLFIGTYFKQQELGFFSMSLMIIAIPSSIISLAMKDVFRQKASEYFLKEGNCKSLFITTFKYLSIISILGFTLLYLISPWLFSFVLGNEWYESGIYSRYLIPMVALSFVTEVLAGVLIIANKMKWEFYWEVVYVLLLCISLFIASKFNSITVMLLFLTISKSLTYILHLIISYKASIGNNNLNIYDNEG